MKKWYEVICTECGGKFHSTKKDDGQSLCLSCTKKDIDKRNAQKFVKEATMGWIGDGMKACTWTALQNRVEYVADKYGLFAPAYPMLIDAVREVFGAESILLGSYDRVCGVALDRGVM